MDGVTSSALNGFDYHGEARAESLGRVDFDPMTKEIRRVLHDEEPKAKPIRPALVDSPKSFENCRQRIRAYADASIAYRAIRTFRP